MSSPQNVIKGYLKTEQMILFVVIAIAVGFVGGVLFSTYRATSQQTSLPNKTEAKEAVPMSPDQQQALKALIDRTISDPKDVDAWTRLGHLYFDHGQPALAIDAYTTSLKIDPQRPDVWTDLGVMYRRNGDSNKAIESFNRATAINSRHQVALFNKGVVMMHDLNNPKAAIEAWETLIQINPEAKTPSGQPVIELVNELKKELS